MATDTATLLETLKAGIATLRTSDAWQRYLDTQAKFHRYSFSNCMLITMQCPRATHVAGFHTWREMKRQVRKGEHGIAILAPMLIKTTPTPDLAPDEHNAPAVVRRFKAVYVFDIAQTDGQALPTVGPQTVEGSDNGLLAALSTYATGQGLTIAYDAPAPVCGSYDHGRMLIRLAPNTKPGDAALTLAHELTHHLLHDPAGTRRNVEIDETTAESVAYIVAKANGLEPTPSFAYIASYDRDGKALALLGNTVQRLAATILDAIAA